MNDTNLLTELQLSVSVAEELEECCPMAPRGDVLTFDPNNILPAGQYLVKKGQLFRFPAANTERARAAAEDDAFWKAVQKKALAKVWDNEKDAVYDRP